ncbi:MAG: ABC transporter permease [Hespellia sp.]|nr:ABC transporter permease [Hespellia sp.]
MTLFNLAWKNIIRDTKTYIYYFMNCAFSVFIFFLFTALAGHPVFKVIDTNSAMWYVLVTAEMISVCFSLIFITYSVKNFLKARGKQFGIIVIHGGTKKQLNKLIFYENSVIGFGAIVSGILIGMLFFKIFLSAAERVIQGVELDFYFPLTAIVTTIIIMGIVFLLISLIAPRLIRKNKVVHLIKVEEIAEKMPKRIWLYATFFISTACIIAGVFATDHGDIVSFFLLPVAVVAVASFMCIVVYEGICFYIFTSKSKGNYYQGVRLLLLSNVTNKIRTNLQLITISAVLYGITFLSVILMVSATKHVKDLVRKQCPYAYIYSSWSEQADTEGNVAFIEQRIQDEPGYKTMKMSFWEKDNEDMSRIMIMPANMYNQIAEFSKYSKVQLQGEAAMVVAGDVLEKNFEIPEVYTEMCQKLGYQLQRTDTQANLIGLDGYFNSTTVVSDEVFEGIKDQLIVKDFYAFDVQNWTSLHKETDEMYERFLPLRDKQEATFISDYYYYETDKLAKNLILYIGSILCFSFLLGITSFIYSRLYSTMEKECDYYKNIVKIGLAKKELKKVLNKYIEILMWTPFVLGLLFLWGGILIIDKMSVISNLGTGIICTVVYIVVQGLMVLLVKRMYSKKIMEGVYENGT